MSILLCDSFENAVVAYIVKKWNELASSKGNNLGRTLIQKLCYFLKAKGIPLAYDFDMYHYGPYSQDLYFEMDELIVDGIIIDKCNSTNKSEYIPGEQLNYIMGKYTIELEKYEKDINEIIALFHEFSPRDLELLATIHYFQITLSKFYKKEPSKDTVIKKVIEAKDKKFSEKIISRAYDALKEAGLFNWNVN